jgi:dihydropteroate synthase
MSRTDVAEWVVGKRSLKISRPLIFGILNTTPDSFSDGAQFESVDTAIQHVHRMVSEGADAIDVGGESTRPQGAKAISVEEERQRVIPIVRAIRRNWPDLPISVDTTKSEIAKAALDEGVDIINDVSGFRLDGRMGEIAARSGAGVVLMHSRGGVGEMGTYAHADYSDVVHSVVEELGRAIEDALRHGVKQEAIVIDPGIGFAKRTEHSVRVLAGLPAVAALGVPVMVGVSRKRFVGELSHVDLPRDRVAGTVGANVAALMRGARLFRVHDVAPNRQALDVAWGILLASVAPAPFSGSRIPDPGSPTA